jgi:hypothetical protein
MCYSWFIKLESRCSAKRAAEKSIWPSKSTLNASQGYEFSQEKRMVTPVVPNQFAVGKNRIVHKPTTATFSFDTGDTVFKSVDWGRAGKQPSSGADYRKDDIMRVAQQLLSKLPR